MRFRFRDWPEMSVHVIVIAFAISFSASALGAPFIPGSDGEVLETLPVKAGDPVARELRESARMVRTDFRYRKLCNPRAV